MYEDSSVGLELNFSKSEVICKGTLSTNMSLSYFPAVNELVVMTAN